MVSLVFLLPFLAGEVLHYETFPKQKSRTFLHLFKSNFWRRDNTSYILLGYLCAVIMIGLQATLFKIGENYLGVWAEYRWMTTFSASYFPFIPAFVVAASASLGEETMFRIFGISIGKKFLKNTAAAIFLSSIIWGFAHSNYPIYPMWFRGFEVSCLGIFLGIIFIRFGILPVLTAHFLFNTFWTTANFTLGTSTPTNFYASIFILCTPLLIALIAFFINHKKTNYNMKWHLTKKQRQNYDVLKYYLKHHSILLKTTENELVKNFVSCGWDIAVVEEVMKEIKNSK